ncbi:cytochrome C [Kineobactrum sediminis]|uniref:Cytochrome C n=1 Tax=Kineobactrum sediminis TaxID=1905677 RepID=A0A2N5Y480_9GAMM|nr:cytochrome c [Kineobactrum sediminis]PLW83178.1 cytochrome C [Kineobactrum sediminis]
MPTRKHALALVSAAALALSPLALSHLDDKEFHQSYRQSYFALLASNFGPMGAMVKGEMPWNQEQLEGFASDFQAVTSLNIMRGFPEGSERGTTRAEPAIWENKEDFREKFGDLKAAADDLTAAVMSGEKDAIAQQVGAVGKTCKACHDEYKSKDYLY